MQCVENSRLSVLNNIKQYGINDIKEIEVRFIEKNDER